VSSSFTYTTIGQLAIVQIDGLSLSFSYDNVIRLIIQSVVQVSTALLNRSSLGSRSTGCTPSPTPSLASASTLLAA